MTKLEKLYSIIENSRDLGVRLNKEVLQQVEELEEGISRRRYCRPRTSVLQPWSH